MVRLRDAPSAVPGTLTRYQVCSLELVVQPLRHLDLLLVRLGRHELPGSLRGLDLGMQPLGGQRTNDLQYVRNESVRVGRDEGPSLGCTKCILTPKKNGREGRFHLP